MTRSRQRPGRNPVGNATGFNIFIWEVAAKRLGLLRELAPRISRVAVLINPGNVPSAEAALRDLPEAARATGLQIQIPNASTSREIEAAFARRATACAWGCAALLNAAIEPTPICYPGVVGGTKGAGRLRFDSEHF